MNSQRNPVADVTSTVLYNLQHQHDWVSLDVYETTTHRHLIRGLPPRRLYIHPDDQIAALEREKATGEPLDQTPELEWVLAVHPEEKWTIKGFSSVFDSIEHKGPREKRLVLATVHNDSTVVYYLMHEGMVKPRQN
ncbi:putative trna splicing endonuclease delta subunit [Fusarium longipes]|uniref:Putative trna splicing endonuclease delta subunit n=1 Tax=Fusarium longipes TaxID=694270 RepID=A0A395SBL7_9HYPO|nr:putative trna splicing endonuclease delta subunit [Fusarium longipes]